MALEDLFKVVKDRSKADVKPKEPKAKKSSTGVEIPKGLLFKCPRCGTVSYRDDFERNKSVCGSCNYHARISAWTRLEMTADKDGDYVKREEYDETTDSKKLVADREAEKAIQYIIRVDPSQEGIIHTNGTRDYKGREVANEGDIIVLKIDVPAGLMIDEVYGDGDHQAHSKLIQDSYGNYFMIVPRCRRQILHGHAG